jgi:hypothetical protein
MMPRPWANLIPDIVVSVANKIIDARDFIMFKAVYNALVQVRHTRLTLGF